MKWGAAGVSQLCLKTINHARDPCEYYYETRERGAREKESRASSLMRTRRGQKIFEYLGLGLSEREREEVSPNRRS